MRLIYLPKDKQNPAKGSFFILECRYEERNIAKAAGFRWHPRGAKGHPATSGKWWTSSLATASQALHYADAETRRQIEAMLRNEQTGRLTLSLAQDKQGKLVFKAECDAATEGLARAAGFKKLPNGPYVSRSPWCALLLKRHADPAAAAELARFEQQLEQRSEMSWATDAAVELACPAGLSYLPYQRAGIAFGMGLSAVLIADEMGLGKTIQGIGIINNSPELRNVLIVCPASLKLNWARELRKWLIDDALHIGIVSGTHWPKAQDTVDDLLRRASRGYHGQVAIINYDILHKAEYRARLTGTHWDLVIADECHYCKNGEKRRSRSFFSIPAKRKVLLTGTPIANRAAELSALLNYLDPEVWGNQDAYKRVFCGDDGKGGSNLDFLQKLLRGTVMIRRLKADVLKDLPPKRRQIIELPADAAEIKRMEQTMLEYRAVLDRMREQIEEAPVTETSAEYAESAASLHAFGEMTAAAIAKIRHETAVSKIPAAIEFLQDAVESSGKVVCFAHHKDVVAGIAAAFGSRAVCLTGDMNMPARQASVDRFQKDDSCQLFIGSIMAAGVGLTLTAASHVVFVEEDWVPGNMSQAEDRCHRIGQKESVLVQHLVLEGSLDAYMVQTLIRKQELIEQALDRREIAA